MAQDVQQGIDDEMGGFFEKGVGIQRQQNPAYEIIYTITEDAANYMATVQVRARVRGHRYGLNDTVVYTGMGYAGAAGKGKVVTYVVRAPKAVP